MSLSLGSFLVKRGFEKAYDRRILASLQNNCLPFSQTLGMPKLVGNYLIFNAQRLPFSDFRIHYDVLNKFMAKIYVLIAEGRTGSENRPSAATRIDLCYSGVIRKGKPFFRLVLPKHSGNASRLIEVLNRDEGLLKACYKLDLEYLRVLYDVQQEIWKIQVRPYGGSFVHILFPPMRYAVVLPGGQAQMIVSAMKDIVRIIGQCDTPEVLGEGLC